MDFKNPDSEPLSIASNNMVIYISCIFSGICFLLAAITLQLTVKVNTFIIYINILIEININFFSTVESNGDFKKCVFLSLFG